MSNANSKQMDQRVHSSSLISASVVYCLYAFSAVPQGVIFSFTSMKTVSETKPYHFALFSKNFRGQIGTSLTWDSKSSLAE